MPAPRRRRPAPRSAAAARSRGARRARAAPARARELVRQERLLVTDVLDLEAPKTRILAGKLKDLGLANVLILVEAFDEKLHLAARNLPYVQVVPVASLDPLSLARHEKVLATVGALKMIEERLA